MVTITHKSKTHEVRGDRQLRHILEELDIIPETVLVIRGDELLSRNDRVGPDDKLELRPVMSGG